MASQLEGKGLKEVKGGLDVQSLVRGSEWLSYAPKLVRTFDGDARQDSLLDIMLWSRMRCFVWCVACCEIRGRGWMGCVGHPQYEDSL